MRRYNKVNIGELSKKIEVSQRHFDIWDAEEMIPTMEYYVGELQAKKKQIGSLNDVLKKCSPEFMSSRGEVITDPIYVNLNHKLQHQCKEYIAIIKKVAELGVIVDDLDVMSFDFYSWLDGEEVMLCWQSGEYNIRFWHYPEESFSERRALDVVDVLSLTDNEQLLH